MTTIFRESFETDGNGTRYTTSVPEFTDGSGDFFTRTDGSNIGTFVQVTGAVGSFWFGAQDIDGAGAASEQSLLFENIDISGITDLGFSVLLAEDDASDSAEDWDLPDFVRFEYRIDGGGFQNLLWIESVPDGDDFNAVPALDTDFDGDGDGATLTDQFQRVSAAIVGTGSSLDLRVTFNLDAGDEDIAIDDLTITGVVPGSAFDLQITEIWFGQDGTDLTGDWFEVTNTGTGAWTAALHGDLYYDDDSADPAAADSVEGIASIAPGESVIVVLGEEADATAFSGVWGDDGLPAGTQVGWSDGAGLGQGGDTVTLFLDADGDGPEAGEIVDQEAFPDAAAASGRSWEVAAGVFASVAGFTDVIATTELGGTNGDEPAIGSPGFIPTPAAGPVTPSIVISEIMFNPASVEDDWEWIELYNAGTVAVDLAGWVVDDNNSVAHGAANIAAGSIAAGTTAVLYNADDVSAADFAAAWGTGINLVAVTNWTAMALNNTGDTVGLWSSFADYAGDNATQANAVVSVAYPGTFDDGAGSIFLTDLTDQASWALSVDGIASPAGGAAYTAAAEGGNSGADVGSPGGTLPPPVLGPAPANVLSVTTLGGLTANGAEIVAFDPATKRGFLTTNVGLEVVDLSNPAAPVSIAVLAPTDNGANTDAATSVAVNAAGLVALAVPDATVTDAGQIFFYDAATLAFRGAVTVGALPDGIAFTGDGARLVVANEGQSASGDNNPGALPNPNGSVSIVTIDAADPAASSVATFDFSDASITAAALRARGARIDDRAGSVAADIEPEFVSTFGNSVVISLQEANAVAIIDDVTTFTGFTIDSIKGLGLKDSSALLADFSDRDGPGGTQAINLTTGNPVFGLYMPDGVATYETGGQRYHIIANEGDDRGDAPGGDAIRVNSADYQLDPTVFPNAAALKQNAALGRLTVSSTDGDTEGDGDFDQIVAFGGRSFSILNEAGQIVFDSADLIERITADLGAPIFDDTRSDNKAAEPEAVTVGEIGGRIYAFVALERSNAIMVFDVTDPTAVVYDQTLSTPGDVAPEGLKFVAAADSPTAQPLLLVSNEVSNTLRVYQFAEEQPVRISAIQGDGAASPLVGQTVTVEAIVVGDFQNGDGDETRNLGGFYLQEEDADADGNALTSEGLFVFVNSGGLGVAPDVNLGDKVRVTGTVAEFGGSTQIGSVQSVQVVSSGNALPTAASVDLSVTPGADLERYEGMLVSFAQTLTVTEQFNLDRFVETRLVQGERPQQFTQTNDPDAAAYAAFLAELAGRSIVYDDGLNVQNTPIGNLDGFGPVYDTANAVRMGDTIDGLSGVLEQSFGAYRVRSTVNGENTFDDTNPRPALPDVGGRLTVASFNVLNFFTTLPGAGSSGPNGLEPRGASNQAEFDRQIEKLITALVEIDADVFGLIEIENTPLDANGDDVALAALVEALNQRIGTPGYYDAIDTGFIGGDAIKVGLVYKTATVAPQGGFAILDSSVDPSFVDTRNRPALAQTFVEIATGEAFTPVVNHFKSKGQSGLNDTADPDFDQGDGQGFWNATRTDAAIALSNWLATDPTGQGDSDYLILGDLNAYAMEDPIKALKAAGYTDLVQTFEGPGAYGYVFDGQTGTLDYALASEPLLAQITGASEWRINSDEADALDYNLDFGRDASIFDGIVPFRSSDHDPIIVGLDLFSEPPLNFVEGTSGNDTLLDTGGADVIDGMGGRRDLIVLGDDDRAGTVDTIVFRADGLRGSTLVKGFDTDTDVIRLVDGQDVVSALAGSVGVTLRLALDSDMVVFEGIHDASAILDAIEIGNTFV